MIVPSLGQVIDAIGGKPSLRRRNIAHHRKHGHWPIWLDMWVDDEDRKRGATDHERWCQCGRMESNDRRRYAWDEERNGP